jgi:hypothetical protein
MASVPLCPLAAWRTSGSNWLDALNPVKAWFISPAISWPRRAASCWCLAGRVAGRDAVYRFRPTHRDIPDALMARIMACRPLVSLNRQEAEIAAERLALARIEGFGAEWVQRFAAPLIVRHDKDGAWYDS